LNRYLRATYSLTVLTLLTGAVLPLWRSLSGSVQGRESGDPITLAVFLSAYALSLTLMLSHRRRAFAILRSNLPLLAVLAVALLSVLWADNPGVTFRRSAALAGTSLFALYLVTAFSEATIYRQVLLSLGLVCLVSLAAVVLLPHWGVMEGIHAGAWRGVFVHKNILGRMAGVALLVGIAEVLFVRRLPAYWGLTLILAGAAAMLGARSAGALVVSLGVLAAGLLARATSRTPLIRAALGCFGGGVLLVLSQAAKLEAWPGMLGREVTLTGRTGLWDTLISAFWMRPLTGFGFDSYWVDPVAPYGSLSHWLSWTPHHAHNGYLEVMLGMGMIGCVALFALVSTLLVRVLRRGGPPGSPGRPDRATGHFRQLALLFIPFLLLINLVESNLLVPNSFLWFLTSLIAFTTGTPGVRGAQVAALGAIGGESPPGRGQPLPAERQELGRDLYEEGGRRCTA
jgi:exopolysaccharide production protein ExoQ